MSTETEKVQDRAEARRLAVRDALKRATLTAQQDEDQAWQNALDRWLDLQDAVMSASDPEAAQDQLDTFITERLGLNLDVVRPRRPVGEPYYA